jgi:NAD(P)-dependent dehydrogenase (short-subunit alcohol dehydrogenase family)
MIRKATTEETKEKVVLVTGAGREMGHAIAPCFSQEGAIVVALDLNLQAAQETVAGLDGRSIARSLNVADSATVAAVVDEVVATFGRFDVLVNNAGIGSVDAFTEIPDETWARFINVNLNGAFTAPVRLCAPCKRPARAAPSST